jgi:hypothetical protein
MLRAAKNGCSSHITFKHPNGTQKVYHDWDNGVSMSSLGKKLDKTAFLKTKVDECNLAAVEKLMEDWYLYENGWHVVYPEGGYKNKHLFYYLCQMGDYGSHMPVELEYFK